LTTLQGGAIPALMVNTGKTSMVQPKRIFQQHNSLVVTLPIAIREKLDLKAGDYLLFGWSERSEKVNIQKFKVKR